jgi:hypothetical protein
MYDMIVKEQPDLLEWNTCICMNKYCTYM